MIDDKGEVMKKIGTMITVATVCALLLWGSSQAALVSVNIVSEEGVQVYGPTTTDFGGVIPGAGSADSVELIPDGTWGWPTVAGAAWITSRTAADPAAPIYYLLFEEDFIPPCTATNLAGTLFTAANSSVDVYFNRSALPIGSGSIAAVSAPILFTPVQGENTFVFDVETTGFQGAPPEHPAGLIYSAAITYDLPNVVWRPPLVGTKRAIVKKGTTLPIKFRLRDAAGRMRTPQNIYLSITGPYPSDTSPAREVVRFTRGQGGKVLRFSRGNGEYKANFQTKLYNLKTDPGVYYTISVNDGCTNQSLGTFNFKVIAKGKKK
jgi:hypothetical protein